MADSVQQRMDQMVPALFELEERGIFSSVEVKAIVDKRREFEYRLRRLVARREDYIRYVDYEVKLEKLRKLRNKKAKAEGRLPPKKANHEYAGIKHVKSIFERATRRFPADDDLWTKYVDWAAGSGSGRAAGGALARALQLRPHVPQLWARAAAHEFFQNGAAAAARALLQRGLRLNRRSPALWAEYFRLEWLYLDRKRRARARRRRRAGGLLGDAAEEEGKEAEGKEEGEEEEEEEEAEAAFFRGAVPLAVFRAACEALPEDLELRWALAARAAAFAGSGEVLGAIAASVRADFGGQARGWALLARFPLLRRQVAAAEAREAAGGGGGRGGGGGGVGEEEEEEAAAAAAGREAAAVFEEGLARLPGAAELWEAYAAFLREGGGGGGDGGGGDGAAAAAAAAAAARCCARGAAAGARGLGLARAHAGALLALGRPGEAARACKVLCEEEEGSLSSDPEMWLLSAEIARQNELFAEEEMNDDVDHKAGIKGVISMVKKGIKSCSKSYQDPAYIQLWELLLELKIQSKQSYKQVSKAFIQALTACHPGGSGPLGEAYLRWTAAAAPPGGGGGEGNPVTAALAALDRRGLAAPGAARRRLRTLALGSELQLYHQSRLLAEAAAAAAVTGQEGRGGSGGQKKKRRRAAAAAARGALGRARELAAQLEAEEGDEGKGGTCDAAETAALLEEYKHIVQQQQGQCCK